MARFVQRPKNAICMAAKTGKVGISLKEPALIALETLRTHKLRSFLTYWE